jgi:hypothetical protein
MIRANLRRIRHITSAVVLLGLSLCGAEVGVRIYEVTHGKSISETTQSECFVDPTHLTVPSWQTNFELKPHAVAEVKCRDSKSKIEVRTNSLGLRGAEVAIPKPPQTYRIVVLGDETIFAPETSEDDHFVRQVGELLHQRTRLNVEVINAGIPGACPLTEFLLLKQKLLAIQPDLVILHYDWSDVMDDRQLRRRTRSDAQGTPVSCAHLTLQPVNRKPHPLDHLRQQFRLVDWGLVAAGEQWKQQISKQAATSRDMGTNAYAWLRKEQLQNDVTLGQSFRPIMDVARLAQGANFQLMVVTSPKPWQVSTKCTNAAGVRLKCGVSPDAVYPNRAPFDALSAFTANVNLPYLDLSPALTETDRPETNYLRYAPRWSPSGHHRVAEHLAAFLVERIPGPWNSRYFERENQQLGQEPGSQDSVRWASGIR